MSKILIVEDNFITSFHLQKLVEGVGHAVVAHLTYAEDVFENVEKFQPDLILLDIMLKGEMNGIAAAHKLRQISESPIIFMSALTDNETLEVIKTISNAIKIDKPFDEAPLIDEINKMLSEK